MAATVVSFGEWLPDLPAIGQHLTNVDGVIPIDGSFEPYKPLNITGPTFTTTGIRGLIGVHSPTNQDYEIYAGDGTAIKRGFLGGGPWVDVSAATYNAIKWQFASYDDMVFAVTTNKTARPQMKTVGTTTAFTVASTTAPTAGAIGVIANFVMVGNLQTGQNIVQWPAIGDPTNWPTPGSATAIATQAGDQILNNLSPVTAIVGGDQFGIIAQHSCMTRVSYVGGSVVFQFDQLEGSVGSDYPDSFVQADGKWYFYSANGFYVTDGVSIVPIDAGVNKFARSLVIDYCYGAVDPKRKLIYWTLGVVASSRILICFNYAERRWAKSTQLSVVAIFGYSDYTLSTPVIGFHQGGTLGALTDTPTLAVLTTADIELNPGGRAYVDGVKPQVESSGTAPAVTVRIGSRNDLGTTPSYTATTTPTTRTGFADFRVDAKYHRAEVQIVGNFTKATGIVVKAFLTGET